MATKKTFSVVGHTAATADTPLAPAAPVQPQPVSAPPAPAPVAAVPAPAPSAGRGEANEARPVSVPPAPPEMDLTDLLGPLTKAASNAALEYAAVLRKVAQKEEALRRAMAAMRQAGASTGDVEMMLMKTGINSANLPEQLQTYTWD